MKKVLVILGPTATGKTDLALNLAKQINGELISCDSRQVYIGLDIGTGKLPGDEVEVIKGDGFWEMDGTKVWMTDVADAKTQFTVKDYVDQAKIVVDDIIKRDKTPIIVGGTGLYLKALLEGLPNLAIPVEKKLRGELESLSVKQLQTKLQTLSPIRWKMLNESDKQNPRRLLRSIELIFMYPYINTNNNEKGIISKYNTLKIGLTASRDFLKKRIFSRLSSRLDQGLIEEAVGLHRRGLSFPRMKELGLEYGILADLLQRKIDKGQFVPILGTKIYQYAKRQMTWFKKEKDVIWFDITDKQTPAKVEKRFATWYYSTYD